MDGSRFDAIARSLGGGTRRSVLRSLPGVLVPTALVALLGDPEAAEAAKNGRCKPACATCQQCKKGKCKKKNGKKKCKKGRCRPAPVGAPCEGLGPSACCPPDTGGLLGGCCPVDRLCCPNASGGSCCSQLDLCCSVTDDCQDPQATCVFNCCVVI